MASADEVVAGVFQTRTWTGTGHRRRPDAPPWGIHRPGAGFECRAARPLSQGRGGPPSKSPAHEGHRALCPLLLSQLASGLLPDPRNPPLLERRPDRALHWRLRDPPGRIALRLYS